jgi:dinuclear metal center YbgI/SA1388 family protein
MAHASLSQIVEHIDALLKPAEFTDWPGAVNGLQVENSGRVTKIAAAVDGTLATVRMAAQEKADFLVVHHGLFWSPAHPWTGNKYRLLKVLLDHDIGVYSSHLPLDAHKKLGNNAGIAAALRFKNAKPFFTEKGKEIGLKFEIRMRREDLKSKLEGALGGPVNLAPGGPEFCRKLGIVSGGAGDALKKASEEGIDSFITGEGPHWSFALAEDLGLNVFYGGHYATEVFGVKSIAAHLSKKFRVPWIFLDHPTGL